MVKSTIKELILKANTIHDGRASNVFTRQSSKDTNKINCILKYSIGLAVEDNGVNKFVTKITYRSKDSDFVKGHGLSIGCYVINLAESGSYSFHNVESNRYIIIMEDVITLVVHEKMEQ